MSRLTSEMVRSGFALLREGDFSSLVGHIRFFFSALFKSRSRAKSSKLLSKLASQKFAKPVLVRIDATEQLLKVSASLPMEPNAVTNDTPVAVIIPVFNDVEHLSKAIDSALGQNHKSTNVYIVDDGSTKEVFQTLDPRILGDKRVRLLRHDRNLGLPAARNTGLAASWEPLVQFLDADDLLAPWAVSRRVSMLSDMPPHSSQIAGAAVGVLQASESFSDSALKHLKDRQGSVTIVDYVNFDFQNPFSVHQPLVLRGALESAGWFDEKLVNGAEDADLWGRLLLNGFGFLQDKNNLGVVYRQRTSNSMVHASPKTHLDELLKVIDRWAEQANKISNAKISLAVARRRLMALGLAIAQSPDDASRLLDGFEPVKVPLTRVSELLSSLLSSLIRGLGFGPLEASFDLKSSNLKGLLDSVSSNLLIELETPLTASSVTLEGVLQDRSKSYTAHAHALVEPGYNFDFTYLQREEGQIDSAGREQLMSLKDSFAGEACVLIGNGPTLNLSDSSEISKFPAFGVNSIFLGEPQLIDAVTFYTVEDSAVMAENVNEINSFISPNLRFFPTENARHLKESSGTKDVFFRMNAGYYGRSTPTAGLPRFSFNPAERLFCGQSVTFINMQLAFWMGFKKVALVGMDFEYTVPESSVVKGNHILSQGDDPNHFHPHYFGHGKTWKDPKLENVEAAYKLAKVIYEDCGREIVNCTPGGKLEVFKRSELGKL